MGVKEIVTKVIADLSSWNGRMDKPAADIEKFKQTAQRSNAESQKSFQDLAKGLERDMRSIGGSLGTLGTGVGSQAQAWNTLSNAAGRAMSRVVQMAGPIGAAVAGIVLLMHRLEAETVAFEKALISSGQTGLYTANMLQESARRSADAIDATRTATAAAIAQAVSSGKVGREALEQVAQASVAMARVSRSSVSEMVQQFASLADAPSQGLLKLNEQHRFLTAEIYRQVRALEDQGLATEATALAQRTYAEAVQSQAAALEQNLGTLESAWLGIKDMAKSAWDAMLDVGREATLEEKLNEARELLNSGVSQRQLGRRGFQPWGGVAGSADAGLRNLEANAEAERKKTEQLREQDRLREAELEWATRGESLLTQRERIEKEIVRTWREGLAANRSVAEIQERIARIRAPLDAAAARDRAKAQRELEAELRKRELAENAAARAETEAIRVARQGLDTIEAQLQRQREQNEEYGLSHAQLVELRARRIEDAAATNEQAAAAAELLGLSEGEIDAYRQKAQLLRELAVEQRKSGENFDELKQAIEGWGRDSAAAIVNFKGSFTDLTDSILSDLARMMVYKNITQPLAQWAGGMDWGGMFSNLFSGFRATGGSVQARGMYEITEDGPETLQVAGRNYLLMGNQGGHVSPLGGARGAGGGGAQVRVNVVNQAGDVARAGASASEGADGGMNIEVWVERIEGVMGRRIAQGGGIGPLLENRYALNPAAGARR